MFGPGDWVVYDKDPAMAFSGPRFVLRRVAGGPTYELDERGHAEVALWMLDDGQTMAQARLKKLDLYELLSQAASIADRLGKCIPVPRQEIETAVVHAHRWMAVIERSYPQEHARHDDIKTAAHVWNTLISNASAWHRMLAHSLPCLATSIGWGGVLCAAEKRGIDAARLIVFASRTREDALAAIDSLLDQAPPKETHEQHDRPPEPGGPEPEQDRDPQVSLRFS